MLLRDALRKTELPEIAAETIRQALHEAGYSYQRTRSWVRTGYAIRKRKSRTVTTYDPETPVKKERSSWRTSKRKRRGTSELSWLNDAANLPAPQPRAHRTRQGL